MLPILAIKSSISGDSVLEENKELDSSIKWAKIRGESYLGTMLVYGDYLYAEKVGNEKSYTSSPVAADKIIYIVDNDGVVYFSVKAGPKFELMEENKLEKTCMSTPAITKYFMFFRTDKHLIAVSGN